MEILKEPAIIFCIVLLIIIALLAVFFLKQFSSFYEKFTNLESATASTAKELADAREKIKLTPGIVEALKAQNLKIAALQEHQVALISEIKHQRKIISNLVSTLKESGVSNLNISVPSTVDFNKKKHKKAKKKEVTFESSTESDNESSDDDDISSVRKALNDMKRKRPE